VDEITLWLESAARYPLLPTDEVLRLAKIIQNKNSTKNARDRAVKKLVRHNLRLVPKEVRTFGSAKVSYNWGGCNTMDLLQQGAIGLVRAAELYDPTRGYAFSTYATPWIRQAVRRFANSNYSSIRIPESTVRDLFNYKHGKRDFKQKSMAGVEERLNYAQAAINVNSLDAPPPSSVRDGDVDQDWYECIASLQERPEAVMSFEHMMDKVSLDPVVVDLIYKRFMLGETNVEIGKQVGLSRSAVSLKIQRGLKKLRRYHCVE
jgi:RNA polymerase primary sigma factor